MLKGSDLGVKIFHPHTLLLAFSLSPILPTKNGQNSPLPTSFKFHHICPIDAQNHCKYNANSICPPFDPPFRKIEGLRGEIEEFSSKTALPVLKTTRVGLAPFRKLISEAEAQLDQKKCV